MHKRIGLGRGMGSGYYNLMPIDSYIHSLSARGIKSVVRLNAQLNQQMLVRVQTLPILVTNKPIHNTGKFNLRGMYHLSSSDAPSRIKEKVYSIFKHRPDLISEIEKAKPHLIIFSNSASPDDENLHGFATPTKYGEWSIEDKNFAGKGIVVVFIPDEKYQRGSKKYGSYEMGDNASTLLHELTHIKQFKRLTKKTLKQQLAKEKSLKDTAGKDYETYRKIPAEEQAFKKQEKYAQKWRDIGYDKGLDYWEEQDAELPDRYMKERKETATAYQSLFTK